MKQFLLALALGMRPARYTTEPIRLWKECFWLVATVKYCVTTNQIKQYSKTFTLNTRFEKGAVEKDKYGSLSVKTEAVLLLNWMPKLVLVRNAKRLGI